MVGAAYTSNTLERCYAFFLCLRVTSGIANPLERTRLLTDLKLLPSMKNLIDKSELISKLQTLKGLTVDERSSLIGLLREHKKYGLMWEDKPEDVEERLRESLPVLREVKDKAILSDEPDAPNHILIEGDNLEALTALSYTHEGKIDVIYIDPPYNTGNKDFVYNDSFVDSEDSNRHSKWLSFMNKRLKIAKKLLSDKGVIFISIDDNEQAQLKLLCDGVFGYDSFMGNISWQRTYSPRNDKKGIVREVEYIAVYSKSPEWTPKKLKRTAEMDTKYKNPDNDIEPWTSGDAFAPDSKQHQGMVYAIQNPFSGEFIYPYTASHWRLGQDEMLRIMQGWAPYELKDIGDAAKRAEICGIAQDEVRAGVMAIMLTVPLNEARAAAETVLKRGQWPKFYFTKNGKGGIRRKTYLQNVDGRIITNLWPYEEVGHTDEAKKELKKLFDGNAPFDTPKPTRLIQRIEQIASDSESIILDFFAGSGTTLHATMQLNAEDGGHRQCILVTNNENNICEEVTYERNKRVIQGYTTPKGQKVEGLKQNSLRYYKTDYISRERTQKNMRDLVAAATDLLCIKEDLYEEQKTFGRFKLKSQLARYFNNGKAHMLIIYREELIDEIAAEIKTMDFGKMRLKIYVFSPGRYPFTDNFSEVEDKVELVALPAAIYDAYQKVLPKRKEKLFEEEKEQVGTKIPADLFEGQGV